MTVDQFRILFPEFDEADPSLIRATLDQAATRLDTEIWGSRFDEIHGLEAANDLAMSPFGRALRQDGSEVTIYQRRINQVRLEALPRWGVCR